MSWYNPFSWGRRTFVERGTDDRRDADYPILPDRRKIVSKRWDCGIRLNQGNEGACVAFSMCHLLAASPYPQHPHITNKVAFDLYHAIQRNDRRPGVDYSGTWLGDAMKYAKRIGLIEAYHWARNVDDMLWALSHKGPLYCKIPIHQGTYRPNAYGQIRPTGKIKGWHGIIADQVDPVKRRIWLLNSWGRAHGRNGRVWLTYEDAQHLLECGARAAVVTKAPGGIIPKTWPDFGDAK